MAVLQMQRISICALKKDRKQILEMLQRRGVVEMNDAVQQDSIFQKTDMSSSQTVFEKSASAAAQALEILEKSVPEKKSMFASLEGKKQISIDNYYQLSAQSNDVMKQVYEITHLSKEIAEDKANILKLSAQIEPLVPWMTLDIPMNFKGTKSTAVFIGSFTGKWLLEDIYAKIAEQAPQIGDINVDIISFTKDQTCVFILCRRRDMGIMEDALRAMSFTYPSSPSKISPAESKKEIEAQIESIKLRIEEAEDKIKTFADLKENIKFMFDYYTLRAEKYGVISNLLQSRRTFVLTGYVPECYGGDLEKELSAKFNLAIEFEAPYAESEDEDVPVLLKNSKFSEPVEWVLESYALPKKGEIDPTPVMSIFYYVLFGMIFSDAAYGLITAGVCGLLMLKFKKMEYGMRKVLRMFFFCGISTMIWGVVFSSYFGDVVDVVSKTFFGATITIPPLWFLPIKDPMKMLMFSLGVGIIHIMAALTLKFIQYIKNKAYVDAVYDVIFWFVLIVGLLCILLSSQMFVEIAKLSFLLPAVAGKIGGYAAMVSSVAIILTAGRESRNWVKRLLKGLYGLYGITGYLGDILSYSRILALGLATGVIASVVNQMGSMSGGGIAGVIAFTLVFIIGHLINFAINILGSYVHTTRLTFVEFFGKFYEGGGRKFEPFAVKSKYYNFKEETK